MRLAGSYHPVAYLLERLPNYLPGVENIHGIWCEKDKSIRSTYNNAPAAGELKATFQHWRNEKSRTQWMDQFDPFHFDKGTVRQMSLSDEDKLDTLLIFFDSPFDELRDIIAIEFPKELFLKNFNVAFSGISVQEKQVLSHLLSSILYSEHKKCLQEREFLQHLNTHHLAQKQKVESLQEQLRTAEKLYSSAISTIVGDLVKTHESALGVSFHIDDSIIRYYAREKISLDAIKLSLDRVLSLAYHMNIGSDDIQVDDTFVELARLNEEQKTLSTTSDRKEDRIMDLLDRYERAAEKVNNESARLNAKEIAQRLDPPVTPPAITDAVKKNKSKIAYYLRQYPGKWKLIRKAIRPIRTIDSQKNEGRQFIS